MKKDQDEQRIRELGNAKAPIASNNPALGSPRPLLATNGQPSAAIYWAYDEKEVKQGKREFQRNWGERVLEDNWRRSEKRGSSNEIEPEEPDTVNKPSTSPGDPGEDPDDITKFLGPVPRTDAERRSAEVKVIDAIGRSSRILARAGSALRARTLALRMSD